ncbi:hypothetical protein U1Q18_005773 [Sarracenia purpurea var. burkii]
MFVFVGVGVVAGSFGDHAATDGDSEAEYEGDNGSRATGGAMSFEEEEGPHDLLPMALIRGFLICAEEKYGVLSGRNQSCGCRCLARTLALLARTIALLGTKDLRRLPSESLVVLADRDSQHEGVFALVGSRRLYRTGGCPGWLSLQLRGMSCVCRGCISLAPWRAWLGSAKLQMCEFGANASVVPPFFVPSGFQ